MGTYGNSLVDGHAPGATVFSERLPCEKGNSAGYGRGMGRKEKSTPLSSQATFKTYTTCDVFCVVDVLMTGNPKMTCADILESASYDTHRLSSCTTHPASTEDGKASLISGCQVCPVIL